MPSILACVFNVLVALAAPLGVLLYAVIKKRPLVLPWLAGAATFFLSQMVLRVPLLGWLGGLPQFTIFKITQPVLYAVFLGLTAGLFEEGGRYLAMRLMRRHRGWGEGVMFGIGHGGLEAIWLVGLNSLLLLFTRGWQLPLIPATQIFPGGLERLFAMLFHIGLSVMVMRSVQYRRPLWLMAAVLLHAALDTGVVLMQQYGAGLWATEAVVAAAGLAFLAYTVLSKPKPATNPPKEDVL